MKTKAIETEISMSRGNPGFTLIETLLAMAIFSIGILAVGSMQIAGVNNNASARMRTEATVLASEKVEELMSLDYDDPLLDSDQHSESSPNNIYCIQWSATEDSPTPAAKTIALSVRWTDGEAGCGNFGQKEQQVDLDFIRANI